MPFRCPHCETPIELVGDSQLNDITCPACGNHFNLANDEAVDGWPFMGAFGHFQLVKRLGIGPVGTVWKARATQRDRVVAIKIHRRQDQLAAKQSELVSDARTFAQLRHPNIVEIHDLGWHDGFAYIVSDFVEGLTLAEWLTALRPTIREAVELCVKIADALEYAHTNGIIHRDLKPSNIKIDSSGEPYVMDFGLARHDPGEVTLTVDGHVLWTPVYMSPEMARGDAYECDSRSDVYSLGAILFELLTGEPPFRGNPSRLLHQVIHEDAPSLRKMNGNVPQELETICLKCLEKDPDRRYPTAAACSADLQRFLRQEPISARPISRIERGWHWCRQELRNLKGGGSQRKDRSATG